VFVSRYSCALNRFMVRASPMVIDADIQAEANATGEICPPCIGRKDET
jgi:hypothetical protein